MKEKLKALVVDEFTSPDIKSVAPHCSLQEAVNLMVDHDIRHLPVLSNGKIEGIISDRDVMMKLRSTGINQLKAEDVMTRNPYIVSPDTPMEEVAFHLSSNKIGSAVVCGNEDEQYVGIFTNTDALNALIELLRGDI